MKVLVSIKRSPTQRYLVRLLTKKLISDVRDLISEQEYSKAVDTICARGRLERHVEDYELHFVEADLMLSETNAYWNHIAKK